MIRFVVFPLLALLFAVWAVALGGLSSLQASCNLNLGQTANAGFLGGVHGFSNDLSCSQLYRWYWWILAYHFVLVLWLAIAGALPMFHAQRTMWVGLFAVATMLSIVASDAFLSAQSSGFFNNGGQQTTRMRVTTAGFIMMSIVDFAMIISLGIVRNKNANNNAGYAGKDTGLPNTVEPGTGMGAAGVGATGGYGAGRGTGVGTGGMGTGLGGNRGGLAGGPGTGTGVAGEPVTSTAV